MATPEQVTEMLLGIAAGDRKALVRLYDATSRKVFGVVLHILANQADAEAVLEDVYVEIWHSAHAYRPSDRSPTTWLFILARNRAIDRIGRRMRTQAEPFRRVGDRADLSP